MGTKKRVYTQTELVKILGASRVRVRVFMYKKGINILNQYCPFVGKTKSGYLLVTNDLKEYSKEISFEKGHFFKKHIIIRNSLTGNLFTTELNYERILNHLEEYRIIALIETDFIDINSMLINNIDDFMRLEDNEVFNNLDKLGIKYLKVAFELKAIEESKKAKK